MPAAEIRISLAPTGQPEAIAIAEVRRRFIDYLAVACAEVIGREWQDATPVRTGNLRDSIYVELQGSEIVLGIDDIGWYAHLVHGGEVMDQYAAIFKARMADLVPAIAQQVLREVPLVPPMPPLPAAPRQRPPLRW